MDATPDMAAIAGLIGDRARAEILMCLMAGKALTATELSRAAGVTKQTASSHLSKLVAARLVAVENAGRHRYFRLTGHDVAAVIENLVGLAQRVGAVQVRSGPADPAMRKARVCYDHLAGELGVLVFDSLGAHGFVRTAGRKVMLTERGTQFLVDFGVDVEALEAGRRPVCLACLDWSVRRHHLAGALGAVLLTRFVALGWARSKKGSRAVAFSAVGERSLRARFSHRPT
ncbi:MAG TPA: helix-turn-helix domain-containing protein [Gemmatimonadaceae bacterium]|nr:helix-turn-helix domain-containing protein [Gemmatimonadaceae bacterium]